VKQWVNLQQGPNRFNRFINQLNEEAPHIVNHLSIPPVKAPCPQTLTFLTPIFHLLRRSFSLLLLLLIAT
jgi:hypothetical protein